MPDYTKMFSLHLNLIMHASFGWLVRNCKKILMNTSLQLTGKPLLHPRQGSDITFEKPEFLSVSLWINYNHDYACSSETHALKHNKWGWVWCGGRGLWEMWAFLCRVELSQWHIYGLLCVEYIRFMHPQTLPGRSPDHFASLFLVIGLFCDDILDKNE